MRTKLISIVICCLFLMRAGVVSAQQQEVSQALDTVKKSEWKWSDRPSMLTITAGFPSLYMMSYVGGDGCYGAYGIRYEYTAIKWLAAGARFQADIASGYTRLDFTLLANFIYVNREHLQVYSGFGFGVADVIEREYGKLGFAGYLTPVGIRAGGKTVFGMAEVNIGSASLLTFGVCFKI